SPARRSSDLRNRHIIRNLPNTTRRIRTRLSIPTETLRRILSSIPTRIQRAVLNPHRTISIAGTLINHQPFSLNDRPSSPLRNKNVLPTTSVRETLARRVSHRERFNIVEIQRRERLTVNIFG